jgi:hypothetical protein
MDRIETYVGQSILEWDFSKPDQNKMVALGKVISSLFGTGAAVNGLPCTQQTVATMFVNLGPGEIYQQAQLEATACGTLPADTTHQISKQGIQLDTLVVPNAGTGITAFVAPGSSGQSINYLIQADYADLDVSIDPTTGLSPVVLPFFNVNNPLSPLQGPGGTGVTSNTFRKGIVNVQVKAGVAATTGSQATPAPDSGFVGLWVVTVAFGQTTVTNSNITAYPGAPVLPSSLLASIQNGNLQYGVDVGSVNTIQAVYPIPPIALVENQPFWVKVKITSTGAVTFTPNAGVITASPVVGAAHAALQGGEFVANGRALLIWRGDISSYVLIGCTGGAEQVPNATQPLHALNQASGDARYQAIGANTGGSYSGNFVVTASTTFTSANIGAAIEINSASATANIMPAASAFAVGKAISFNNIGAGIATFTRAGSDTITGGNLAAATALPLNQGECVTLVSDGTSKWYVAASNVTFFGAPQSLQNVTGSRVAGTTYTNSTGRQIEVIVTGQMTTNNAAIVLQGLVNGSVIRASQVTESNGSTNQGFINSLSLPVANNATYSFQVTGGTTLVNIIVSEMR